jgi:hypothetical protein
VSLPGRLEPVHPIVSIDSAAVATSVGAVIASIADVLSKDLEWSEDESGVFGQMSCTTPTANLDVKFIGEGVCGTVRIVAGSCGERPVGGHWTSTLDVTGMSPAIAALPRVERVRTLVTLCGRLLGAATSDEALPRDVVHEDAAWNAARRHAQGLAAELGSSLGEDGCTPMTEVMVRHPYAGAPGIVTMNDGRDGPKASTPCDVSLPSLASIVFIGTGRDGTVYVSGCMRTASVRAAMIDPITTLRLLKDLAEARDAHPGR